ncbi:hypothetical protein L7F22_061714 [Adiantum nelumboides]|nr:hypothetical protein [Adiantum nelumboides]
MTPRLHRCLLAAFEALFEHAEFGHKPLQPPCYGRWQSFNRQQRRDVPGTADHGGFNKTMLQKRNLHFFEERQRPAIHPSFSFTENFRFSSCRMCSSFFLRQGMHVQAFDYSSKTGENCIHAQHIFSIMQHDPVQAPLKDEKEEVEKKKPVVVVVLLGWLGAKHRHLKKYADWYTSQGMHAVTFTIPIKDVLTLRVEKHVEMLSQKLLEGLREENSNNGREKLVIIQTFSNTGWMTYGALLERLLRSNEGVALVKRIKGCVVDSGPAPKNDPRVWAAGLCAALLKKSSVATQLQLDDEHKLPSMKETVLILIFEKLLAGFLCIPYVKRRIDNVVLVLSRKQPSCPQLYLYSNADTVIPATSVESFIAEQQRAGCLVRACNFDTSPHVDHFRSFPVEYMEQIASFLECCLPQNGKDTRCVT